MLVSKFNLIAEARRSTQRFEDLDYEPLPGSTLIRSDDFNSLKPLRAHGFTLKRTSNHFIAYKGEIKAKRGTTQAYIEEMLEINKDLIGTEIESVDYLYRKDHRRWEHLHDVRKQMIRFQTDLRLVWALDFTDIKVILNFIEQSGLTEFWMCDHRHLPYIAGIKEATLQTIDERLTA